MANYDFKFKDNDNFRQDLKKIAKCINCGKRLPWPKFQTNAKYCSKKCRLKVYRKRKTAKKQG